MYTLILKQKAVEMAADAFQWYEDQHTGLGEIFISTLDSTLKKIQSFPTAHTKVKKDYRQVRLKKFPYVIVYEILKTEVVVLAIFHTKRHPRRKFR